MPFNDLLDWAPVLEDAIDRQPLIVLPDTELEAVIALIHEARSNRCPISTLEFSGKEILIPEARSSCVLVMQDNVLRGIFTERDIVGLTATGMNFAGVPIAEVMAHPVKTLSRSAFQDIFAALFLFRRYRIRHLPIVDDQDQVIGVVSPESIRQILRPANLLRLRRVADVMVTEVIQASPNASVLSLARLMAEHQVSCVVITKIDLDGHCHPIGIVTERDIVQFQALQVNLHKTQAQTVMSTPLFLLSPEDSLWTAHQEMQRRRLGRLVVSWNWGQKLGIVTQTNLLRVFDPTEMYGVIENLQQTIEQLRTEKIESVSYQTSSSSPVQREQSLPNSLPESTPSIAPSSAVESPLRALASSSSTHELRSLVTATQGYLEKLATGADYDPLQQAALEQAMANLGQILELIQAVPTLVPSSQENNASAITPV